MSHFVLIVFNLKIKFPLLAACPSGMQPAVSVHLWGSTLCSTYQPPGLAGLRGKSRNQNTARDLIEDLPYTTAYSMEGPSVHESLTTPFPILSKVNWKVRGVVMVP